MKPNETHSQTHTRNTTEREIARGKQSMRDRDQEVLTYDGWQRGLRRWRWRSVLRAAVGIDSPSGDGNRFSERRWRRWEAAVAACCWEWGFVWESREESDRSELQLRDLSWKWGFFCCWEWASVVFDVWVFFCFVLFCFFFFFFFYLFILNLELLFIKRSSIWIEAAFY